MFVESGRYALIIGNSQYTDKTLKKLIAHLKVLSSKK